MSLNEPWLDRARACAYTRPALTALGTQLPADDGELDRLLGLAVAGREAAAFTHLLLGALGAGRSVTARHLPEGAALFPEPGVLAACALRLKGDVGTALVEAVRLGRMGNEREAVGLLLAGIWGQRQKPEPILSPGVIACARTLARDARGNIWAQQCLLALAELTGNESLFAVLRDLNGEGDPQMARELQAALAMAADLPVLECVPDKAGREISSGFTMRRAVARIGRNDPCPCGSGKKYKQCCLEKDQERLQHSSEVEGLTQEELEADLERHLTLRHIQDMRSYQLARLDPLKLSPHLHAPVITRLVRFEELDRVAEFFEAIGFRPELGAAWEESLFYAKQKGRRDMLRRLLAVGPPDKATEAHDFETKLLLEEDPGKQLALLDAETLQGLREESERGPLRFVDIAYALLDGAHAPLGILFTRGLLATASFFDAITLLETLQKARDRLELPPDDPAEDLLDRWFAEASKTDSSTSEKLSVAKQRLAEKSEEIRELRQSLELARVEMKNRQAPATPLPTAAAPPTPVLTPAPAAPAVEDRVLGDLRQKVDYLRNSLRERHAERNQLRRELEDTRATLAALQQNPPSSVGPTTSTTAGEPEDELLLEADSLGTQPVRVIHFPRRFPETLQGFPRQVAQAALVLLGRLAAGDPSAFTGTKRLRANRSILRQRLAGDYRLLFGLESDVLTVHDLIHRRDLERRIKTLT